MCGPFTKIQWLTLCLCYTGADDRRIHKWVNFNKKCETGTKTSTLTKQNRVIQKVNNHGYIEQY